MNGSLQDQITELQYIVALLVARTGADHVTLTAAEMIGFPAARFVQLAVWRNPLDLSWTVAVSGLPPIDGIVDAEWTEEPGPKAIGA